MDQLNPHSPTIKKTYILRKTNSVPHLSLFLSLISSNNHHHHHIYIYMPYSLQDDFVISSTNFVSLSDILAAAPGLGPNSPI